MQVAVSKKKIFFGKVHLKLAHCRDCYYDIYGSYVVAIWFLCVALWLICGWYVVDMWSLWRCFVGTWKLLCCFYAVAMRLICGCYAVDMQLLCGCYVVAMQLPWGCYTIADPFGSIGIHWGSIGIHWNPFGSIGFHWDPLGFTWIHFCSILINFDLIWSILDPFWFNFDSLGSISIHCDWLGSIGIQRV